MTNLIKVSDISNLARPISGHIDDVRVEAYITESQQVKIRKAIGAELLLSLTDSRNHSASNDLLLNGGTYDSAGVKKHVRGLRVALAYITYAKLVINNPVNVTRSGTRVLNSENSQSIDWKQLTAIAADAESYGDDCIEEVLELLNAKSEDYPLFAATESKPVRGRTTIISIGQ